MELHNLNQKGSKSNKTSMTEEKDPKTGGTIPEDIREQSLYQVFEKKIGFEGGHSTSTKKIIQKDWF